MHRLTAKALVSILLLGTFAPFAAAALANPGSATGDHCARRPASTVTETPSGCHHHAAAKQTASVPAPRLHLSSKPCCNGHECCRSQVRTQWADVSLPTQLRQVDRMPESVCALAVRSHASGVEFYLPGRAPPAL